MKLLSLFSWSISIFVFTFSVVVYPPKTLAIKRIYIAPDDHTDYFWSADDAVYKQAFLDMLDYYINLADSTASNPSDFQSRFSTDGSFWLWIYEQNKSASQFEKLISRIKDGHITSPLNGLAITYGAQSAESIIRGMYYPGQLERRFGLRFPLALSQENQTLPFGLGSIWAGAGADYSWKGVCRCNTQVSDPGNRQYQVYNWTGRDGSSILMKWYSMNGWDSMSLGGYAEARYPSTVVDILSGWSSDVTGAFGKGWDDVTTRTNEFISVAQSKSNSSRRVIVSNMIDFFQDYENTYGGSIPSQGVTFGNEWEIDYASISEINSRVKRSVEKLRTAEALATLVSLKDASFLNGRETNRNKAWVDLAVFWEHCLGATPGSYLSKRVNWQKTMANEIQAYVNTLTQDALARLGQMIAKSGTYQRFFVFNPLSWQRNDYVDFPYSGSSSIKVVDLSTGQEVPFQLVTVDSSSFLRVLASNVPSVGYKVYEIRSGLGQSFSDAATVNGSVLENSKYKITLANRGAITSLVDKQQNNREFVKTVNSRVINDLGSTTNGTISIENQGPVSVTLKATSSSPLQHDSRITLIRDVDRIDIRNDINQVFDSTNTWGFGFNISNPQVWHEELGAVILAKLAPTGHYSNRPQNSRFDWLTLNHFADMSESSTGITLSNSDLAFMRLGNSTVTSLDTATSQISPLAGGRIYSQAITNQASESHFLQRFALQTHGVFNQVEAMRFALEHQNPFITGEVSGGSDYPETSYSLLTISEPEVMLWTLKPAEEGIAEGIIARVWNLSNNSKNFTLSMIGNQVESAKHTSHIETNLSDALVSSGSLTASTNSNQIKTFRLMTSATSLPTPSPSPSASPIPGCESDINGDGTVNLGDIVVVLSAWGQSGGTQDLNGDGTVNLGDIVYILSNWGLAC